MRYRLIVVFMVVMLAASFGVLAQQETEDPAMLVYVVAPDEEGIRQVWTISTESAQQITQSTSDINGYDVLSDGSVLTYATQEAVFFQPLDGNNATTVATLTGDDREMPRSANPNLNTDGSQIIYADEGLYLVDTQDGTPSLLVADNRDITDIENYTFLRKAHFLNEETLLATIGIWEAQTPGIVDINAGTLTEAPRYERAGALALEDGRIVLYSSSLRGFSAGLDIATPETIAQPEPLVDGGFGVGLEDQQVVVRDMVEVDPGVLRILLQWFDMETPEDMVRLSIIDFDIDAGSSDFVIAPAVDSLLTQITLPQLSPDGQLIGGFGAFERNTSVSDTLIVMELETQTLVDLPETPTMMGELQFAK